MVGYPVPDPGNPVPDPGTRFRTRVPGSGPGYPGTRVPGSGYPRVPGSANGYPGNTLIMTLFALFYYLATRIGSFGLSFGFLPPKLRGNFLQF